MHNPESVQENEMHKLLWDFEIQTNHLISARRPDLVIINNNKNKKKEKESKKKDKYRDLARELKKLWSMKLMVISVVIGALCTVIKGLVKGLEDLKIRGGVKTIQAKALLGSAKILRRVLETWKDLLWLKSQWETIGKHWCEKLEKE